MTPHAAAATLRKPNSRSPCKIRASRIPGLGAPGNDHVEPHGDGDLEEPRRLVRQGAQSDEVREAMCLDHELADVDR